MPGNPLMRRVAALLKSLFRTLPDTSVGSTPILQPDVQPSESLSAFVFRTDQVVKKTNTIHHSRLMPRRKNRNKKERLETSVCRSQNLSDTQVWEICAAHFDLVAPKPAIGRGVGPAAAVFDVDLGFDADGKPYLEHANIIGWYDSIDTPDDELKHFWMDKAQKIAPRFTYVPRQ